MKTDLFLYGNDDIFLFKKNSKKVKYGLSELKDFIQFMKFIGHQSAKFSHVSDNCSLLNTLTIEENIVLESTKLKFSKDKKLNLKECIKNIKNPFIEQLLRTIPDLHLYPTDLNKEQQKVVDLIKGLLQNTKFLFLQSPETLLSPFSQELVSNAILEEVSKQEKIVFISTSNSSPWTEIITKIIFRNEENEFRITNASKTRDSKTSFEKEREGVNLKFSNRDNLKKTA